MKTWVLLLRGINVGGHGKLPMADLKAHLTALGADQPQTYIQSGNAVFSGAIDPVGFADALEAMIETQHGFRPRALVLDAAGFRAIHAAFPFPEATGAPKTGHIWFCATPPVPDLAALQALASPTERFALTERVLYLHAPDGIGRSKLAEKAERLLGVAATARNLNTTAKLCDLLAARD